MKSITSRISLGTALVKTAVVAAVALSLSPAEAQSLLSPVGMIYESSQNTTRTAANLFGGTAVIGVAQPNLSTTGFFAGRSGAAGDARPIVAFDLGAVNTVGGLAYAQNVLGNPTGADKVASIDIYALNFAEYTSFITTLQAAPSVNSGSSSGSTVSLAAPTVGNYLFKQSVSVTDIGGDGVLTEYNFSSPITAQYYAVQFTGVASGTGSGGFPGGQEMRLVASVPEPSTSVLVLGGMALLGLTRRLRRQK